MESLQTILNLLREWVAAFSTIAGGFQLATILGCGALAYLTHNRWQQFITRLLGGFEKEPFIRFVLRATDRAAFPMSMLIYLIVCRFVLQQFELNVAILDIFTPLLLSLAAIRLTIYTLRKGFSPSPALQAWEGVISLSIWGLVALHLVGWLPDILKTLDSFSIDLGEGKFSLLSLIKLVLAILIFVVMANWLVRTIERRASRSTYMSPSMRVGMTKVSKFALYTFAFLFALKSVGIDLTTFAVFSGAIGVGIGFGLQKVFSNFISGFILLFDRSIKPGDVITVGERFGWVVALYARYVVVRDRDGVETLIPNENLITSEVTNWSYTDRTVRMKIPVMISYGDDPELAMQLMNDAAIEHPRVLSDPAPAARLMEFSDNGISLEVRIWIIDPEQGISSVRSDINLAIWQRFKENSITIPFPQRDVRLLSTPDNRVSTSEI